MQRPDDSRINRFDDPGVRHVRARDAVLAIATTALLLIVFAGGTVRSAAETIDPGIGRDLVEAVGDGTGWIADELPFADARSELTDPLSPDTELVGDGFAEPGSQPSAEGPSAVTEDYFDAFELGTAEPDPSLPLERVLVTGDSMSVPLDSTLARRLSEDGIETTRDPHLGTGISRTDLVDWRRLSATQAQEEPDAVVVFLGAGDGYPMPGADGRRVECCSPEWAAIYANRARQVMDNYRRDGATRVYWLTVPTPRDEDRARITRVVNAALEAAAAPWRSQVRIIDTIPTFTPGATYRDSIEVDGRDQVVRESDGLHLNQAGAEVAADLVEERLDRDFVR